MQGIQANAETWSASEQTVVLFNKAPDRLTEDNRHHLALMFERDAELRPIYEIVQQFGQMVLSLGGKEREAWLKGVERAGCPPLISFAARVRQDLAAVKQRLTQRYS